MRNVKVAVELKVVIPVCFFERAGNKAFNSVAMIDANCRNQLPPEITVIEMSTNDAWARDCGPSFFVNDHGDLRPVTGHLMHGASCRRTLYRILSELSDRKWRCDRTTV